MKYQTRMHEHPKLQVTTINEKGLLLLYSCIFFHFSVAERRIYIFTDSVAKQKEIAQDSEGNYGFLIKELLQQLSFLQKLV